MTGESYAETLAYDYDRPRQFLDDEIVGLLRKSALRAVNDLAGRRDENLVDSGVLPPLSLDKDGHSPSFSADSNGSPSRPEDGQRAANEVDQTASESALLSLRALQLQEKYGIQIAEEGEPVRERLRQTEEGKFEGTGEWVRARKPTVDELDALEGALERSMPSTRTADGKPLLVRFAESGFLPGSGGRGERGKANFEPPNAEHPDAAALNVWPGAKDVPARNSAVAGEMTHENTSLERILTHELSHLSTYNIEGMGMEVDAQYKRDSGWIPTEEPPGQTTLWALRGKDGNLFVPRLQPGEHPQIVWMKMQGEAGYDENGQYQGKFLDADGNVVAVDEHGRPEDASSVVTLSNEQMRSEAKVTPATDYFTIPEESFAEAIAEFRTDMAGRSHLLADSPETYGIVKAHDQAEIDKFAGLNEDGASCKIRLPDGRLGENNGENRSWVAFFEAAASPRLAGQ